MAVSFITEDGTGMSTATSYISLAELAQYAENYGYDVSGLTTDDLKKQACNKYTQIIDNQYTWPGYKKTDDQALQWPRMGAVNSSGYNIDDDIVPVEVKKALVIMIAYSLAGNDLVPVQGAEGAIKRKSVSISGAVSEDVEYWSNGSSTPSIPEISFVLRPIIGNPGKYNMRSER